MISDDQQLKGSTWIVASVGHGATPALNTSAIVYDAAGAKDAIQRVVDRREREQEGDFAAVPIPANAKFVAWEVAHYVYAAELEEVR